MEASTEEPGPDSDLAASKQGHDKSTEGVADKKLCVTSSASTEAVNPSPIHTAPAPDTMPAGESAAPTSDPSPTNHKDQEGDSKAAPSAELANCSLDNEPIVYSNYESELQMPEIMRLIQKDLSEPYSIYTYRYFINNWPNLCFLARHAGRIVGAIVCKLDSHDSHTKRAVTSRGYIAMLAVDQQFRKRRIGSCLVLNAIRAMAADAADEVVLETEVTNKGALRLYENLGFVRDKRLFRYYLNGVDALRLKLWLWPP
ncbi:N-alpha-acetyltransferase 30 [Amphibalanus amphitrite]|uniref:N-terminal methionine N(alpha)-acetyltransferase NatC n=1 Tax=Amphibalanus amphitrite TaxID=1232801 RepID=A0A6A4VRK7_AMPAM|nr:N-alpha-acetyltransferase 30 [Amphibalanus amphitrite]